MLQARWFFQQMILGLDYCHSRVSAIAYYELCSTPSGIHGRWAWQSMLAFESRKQNTLII